MGVLWFGSAGAMGLVGLETEGFGMGDGIELEDGGRRASWWFGAQVGSGIGIGDRVTGFVGWFWSDESSHL